MTAVNAWLDMLRQSVTIAPRTGSDLYGNPTYGAGTSYRCRLVGKRKLVLNDAGREVMSRQTLYLAANVAVDPQAKVTLSTADVGSTESFAINPPIVSTARMPDEAGWHHSVLYLQ